MGMTAVVNEETARGGMNPREREDLCVIVDTETNIRDVCVLVVKRLTQERVESCTRCPTTPISQRSRMRTY